MLPPGTRGTPIDAAPGRLRLLDQRRLPREEAWIDCGSADAAAEAIRSLAVRGAPLIGVAAAWGLAAEARRLAEAGGSFDAPWEAAAARLEKARPTAVNLRFGVERMRGVFRSAAGASAAERVARLEAEAARFEAEDREACAAMGRHGADWIAARLGGDGKAPLRVLTHCNAGALATAGVGTALGVVRALATVRPVAVFADETRPFWQGARLTAWELAKDGIDVTILPDVAAASVIASGKVSVAVVGADRIAANGDVANKVGTYGVALACRAHGVPFVVAAPRTTLDPGCPSGRDIPIEWRDGAEVLLLDPAGESPLSVAPVGVPALYPAFDVTPAELVDAIVTEAGVSTAPHAEGLARLLALP
ncbi:MAG TPA: S-methyl-5-thioribose-1-phosphate isomerase [Thermoanaerobaculia bacterium]|nr:S-methyl-5-thioribose-1-phosphate isomerase [Thermoanaerobaculia bacterium]